MSASCMDSLKALAVFGWCQCGVWCKSVGCGVKELPVGKEPQVWWIM